EMPAVVALLPVWVHVVVAGARLAPVAGGRDVTAAFPAPIGMHPDVAGARRRHHFHDARRRRLRRDHFHHFGLRWRRLALHDHFALHRTWVVDRTLLDATGRHHGG